MYEIILNINKENIIHEKGNKGYIDFDFIYAGYKVREIIEKYLNDYEYKFLLIEENDFDVNLDNKEDDLLMIIEEEGLYALSILLEDIMKYDVEGLWDYNQANVYINGNDKHLSVSFRIEHKENEYYLKVICYDNYNKKE